MAQVEFSVEELIEISMVIEDITQESEEGVTGGMYTGKTYLSPEQCYHMANILKKINESMYDKPTIYQKAYVKYRRYQNSK